MTALETEMESSSETCGKLMFYRGREGSGMQMSYPLEVGTTIVGSSLDADVRLKIKHDLLESIHCTIEVNENGYATLTNKSIKAPVLINNIPVRKAKLLVHEDIFDVVGKKFQYLNDNIPKVTQNGKSLPVSLANKRRTMSNLLQTKSPSVKQKSPKFKTRTPIQRKSMGVYRRSTESSGSEFVSRVHKNRPLLSEKAKTTSKLAVSKALKTSKTAAVRRLSLGSYGVKHQTPNISSRNMLLSSSVISSTIHEEPNKPIRRSVSKTQLSAKKQPIESLRKSLLKKELRRSVSGQRETINLIDFSSPKKLLESPYSSSEDFQHQINSDNPLNRWSMNTGVKTPKLRGTNLMSPKSMKERRLSLRTSRENPKYFSGDFLVPFTRRNSTGSDTNNDERKIGRTISATENSETPRNQLLGESQSVKGVQSSRAMRSRISTKTSMSSLRLSTDVESAEDMDNLQYMSSFSLTKSRRSALSIMSSLQLSSEEDLESSVEETNMDHGSPSNKKCSQSSPMETQFGANDSQALSPAKRVSRRSSIKNSFGVSQQMSDSQAENLECLQTPVSETRGAEEMSSSVKRSSRQSSMKYSLGLVELSNKSQNEDFEGMQTPIQEGFSSKSAPSPTRRLSRRSSIKLGQQLDDSQTEDLEGLQTPVSETRDAEQMSSSVKRSSRQSSVKYSLGLIELSNKYQNEDFEGMQTPIQDGLSSKSVPSPTKRLSRRSSIKLGQQLDDSQTEDLEGLQTPVSETRDAEQMSSVKRSSRKSSVKYSLGLIVVPNKSQNKEDVGGMQTPIQEGLGSKFVPSPIKRLSRRSSIKLSQQLDDSQSEDFAGLRTPVSETKDADQMSSVKRSRQSSMKYSLGLIEPPNKSQNKEDFEGMQTPIQEGFNSKSVPSPTKRLSLRSSVKLSQQLDDSQTEDLNGLQTPVLETKNSELVSSSVKRSSGRSSIKYSKGLNEQSSELQNEDLEGLQTPTREGSSFKLALSPTKRLSQTPAIKTLRGTQDEGLEDSQNDEQDPQFLEEVALSAKRSSRRSSLKTSLGVMQPANESVVIDLEEFHTPISEQISSGLLSSITHRRSQRSSAQLSNQLVSKSQDEGFEDSQTSIFEEKDVKISPSKRFSRRSLVKENSIIQLSSESQNERENSLEVLSSAKRLSQKSSMKRNSQIITISSESQDNIVDGRTPVSHVNSVALNLSAKRITRRSTADQSLGDKLQGEDQSTPEKSIGAAFTSVRRSQKSLGTIQLTSESQDEESIEDVGTPVSKENVSSNKRLSRRSSLKAIPTKDSLYEDMHTPISKVVLMESASTSKKLPRRSSILSSQRSAVKKSVSFIKFADESQGNSTGITMRVFSRKSSVPNLSRSVLSEKEDFDMYTPSKSIDSVVSISDEDSFVGLPTPIPTNVSKRRTRQSPLNLTFSLETSDDSKIFSNSTPVSLKNDSVITIDEFSDVTLNTSSESEVYSSKSSLFVNFSKVSRRSENSKSISVSERDSRSFPNDDDDSFKENQLSNTLIQDEVSSSDFDLNTSRTKPLSTKMFKRLRESSIGELKSNKRRKVQELSFQSFYSEDVLSNLSGLESSQSPPQHFENLTNKPVLTDPQTRKRLSQPNKKNPQKSPRNDYSDVAGLKRLLRTPKQQNKSENDLSNVSGIKELISTPGRRMSTRNSVVVEAVSVAAQKSLKNDLTNIVGIKKLMATPKVHNSPKNDLTHVAGIKKLMATPAAQKSPKNDLTNIVGIKKLMATPKARNSPKNDLTHVAGVKKLLSTPVIQKSPKNDLTNVAGIKKLMSTPKMQNSPKNDLTKITGVKKIMSTPVIQKPPKNDLSNVAGMKKLMSTPTVQKSPRNDLSNVAGVKKLMSTPKIMNSPRNDLSDVEGVSKLFADNNDDLFSKVFSKKPLRTYRGQSISPIKGKEEPNEDFNKSPGAVPERSPRVESWVQDQAQFLAENPSAKEIKKVTIERVVSDFEKKSATPDGHTTETRRALRNNADIFKEDKEISSPKPTKTRGKKKVETEEKPPEKSTTYEEQISHEKGSSLVAEISRAPNSRSTRREKQDEVETTKHMEISVLIYTTKTRRVVRHNVDIDKDDKEISSPKPTRTRGKKIAAATKEKTIERETTDEEQVSHQDDLPLLLKTRKGKKIAPEQTIFTSSPKPGEIERGLKNAVKTEEYVEPSPVIKKVKREIKEEPTSSFVSPSPKPVRTRRGQKEVVSSSDTEMKHTESKENSTISLVSPSPQPSRRGRRIPKKDVAPAPKTNDKENSTFETIMSSPIPKRTRRGKAEKVQPAASEEADQIVTLPEHLETRRGTRKNKEVSPSEITASPKPTKRGRSKKEGTPSDNKRMKHESESKEDASCQPVLSSETIKPRRGRGKQEVFNPEVVPSPKTRKGRGKKVDGVESKENLTQSNVPSPKTSKSTRGAKTKKVADEVLSSNVAEKRTRGAKKQIDVDEISETKRVRFQDDADVVVKATRGRRGKKDNDAVEEETQIAKVTRSGRNQKAKAADKSASKKNQGGKSIDDKVVNQPKTRGKKREVSAVESPKPDEPSKRRPRRGVLAEVQELDELPRTRAKRGI